VKDWEADLGFALDFATWAGRSVNELVAAGFEVATKADASPVTTVDQVLNDRFVDEVRERFPGDGVLGEEGGFTGVGERVWVIDPVDGTQQLILGIPLFMVSIALVVDGSPVVAVAHNPSTGETYRATFGGGAFRGERRLAVSGRDGVGEIATVNGGGSVPTAAGLNADTLLQLWEQEPLDVHRFPWPSVFSGCKVAEGAWEADLYSGTAPWDCAAVALLVTEAGGTVSDRLGRQQRYDTAVNGCVLSNGLIHQRLVQTWSAQYLPRA
jgi:fructose-1,6-bisphosphatase/inositol monophosphatase family enzyme